MAKAILKEAVVILPYRNDKILLQLRDKKADIFYPGNWGFFGGSIEEEEAPIQSAKRELCEEIGYRPKKVYLLSQDLISIPSRVRIHAFYCYLNIPLAKINLHEGYDFGFFRTEEILSKKLFSAKNQKMYELINNPYMEYLIKKFMRKKRIKKQDGN